MPLECKTFEVRDRGTFIPAVGVLVILTQPELLFKDRYLLARAGYGETPLILFGRLDGDSRKFPYDPSDWGDRTMQVAHGYACDQWLNLKSGDVIDVEFILGETPAAKESEQSQ